MESLVNFLENTMNLNLEAIIKSIIIILVAILIYQIFRYPAKRVLGLSKKKSHNTYLSMIGSFVKLAYILVVSIFLLQYNGVDVTGLFAGTVTAAAIVGLAVQDTLKDIIRGISIVSDDYYKVGEYVTIGDISGTVLSVGIRSTKIQDMGTGAIHTLANRNIERASTSGLKFAISVPLPYDLKVEKAEAIMEEIANEATLLEDVQEIKYVGVDELADSAIIYKLFGTAKAKRKIQAKRSTLRTALITLEKHKISVPYPQLDVHQK